jgi:hypothetical protein
MGGRYWLWLGARLAVGFAIVAWAFSYVGTGNGEKEFQKTLDAMKQVRSFRAATTASQRETQHHELQWEVDCSRDILHFKRHLVDTSTDPATDFQQDQLIVSGREYDRQGDGAWARPNRYGGPSFTARGYCNALLQGVDSNILPQIYTMIQRGVLEKGDKKTVNGVRCREWLVTLRGGPSRLEHDTVCIGLKDHLPYEMTVDWEHARTTFSDYNKPLQFDLPDTELQAASTSGSSN